MCLLCNSQLNGADIFNPSLLKLMSASSGGVYARARVCVSLCVHLRAFFFQLIHLGGRLTSCLHNIKSTRSEQPPPDREEGEGESGGGSREGDKNVSPSHLAYRSFHFFFFFFCSSAYWTPPLDRVIHKKHCSDKLPACKNICLLGTGLLVKYRHLQA